MMGFIFEFVKRRVSKEKIRFTENGFDLDLTCILSGKVYPFYEYDSVNCKFGIQLCSLRVVSRDCGTLPPRFPPLRPYLGNRLSACGKYGGLLVKCDWVFSLIAVVCGGILQFQT